LAAPQSRGDAGYTANFPLGAFKRLTSLDSCANPHPIIRRALAQWVKFSIWRASLPSFRDAKGCVIGFVEINWHGLIIAGFHINTGPRGLFLEFPQQRTASGRWIRIARFKTVREQEAFRTEVLAALMRVYPEDFVEAEPPRR
jgi:DNA-binding cell septation regulator SpoVG